MGTPIIVILDPERSIPDPILQIIPSHSGPNTRPRKNDRLYGKGNVIAMRDFLKLLWKQKTYVQLGIWPLLKYKIPKTVHLRRKTIIPGLIRPGSKVKYAVTFSYTKLKLV